MEAAITFKVLRDFPANTPRMEDVVEFDLRPFFGMAEWSVVTGRVTQAGVYCGSVEVLEVRGSLQFDLQRKKKKLGVPWKAIQKINGKKCERIDDETFEKQHSKKRA